MVERRVVSQIHTCEFGCPTCPFSCKLCFWSKTFVPKKNKVGGRGKWIKKIKKEGNRISVTLNVLIKVWNEVLIEVCKWRKKIQTMWEAPGRTSPTDIPKWDEVLNQVPSETPSFFLELQTLRSCHRDTRGGPSRRRNGKLQMHRSMLTRCAHCGAWVRWQTAREQPSPKLRWSDLQICLGKKLGVHTNGVDLRSSNYHLLSRIILELNPARTVVVVLTHHQLSWQTYGRASITFKHPATLKGAPVAACTQKYIARASRPRLLEVKKIQTPKLQHHRATS